MTSKVQQAHSLTAYYVKKYKERYNREPVLNRNTAKWDWENILTGLNVKEIRQLIDYYFSAESSDEHDFKQFTYKYHLILDDMHQRQEDLNTRKKLMQESQKRTEDWKRRFGK